MKDYRVLAWDKGKEKELAKVTGNHQRRRNHDFAPLKTKSIRIEVQASWGAAEARIYGIRMYRQTAPDSAI
ncbi:MAG: hypothetical protein HQL31_02450 [Planctomycetes bacterium]|nr:hypothetical protein [Planctomycetota bacterium]